jgi:hypothetical protein
VSQLVGLLYAVAALAVAGAGFATMAGVATLRSRLFGYAIVAVLVALALPPVVAYVGQAAAAVGFVVHHGVTGAGGAFPIWPIVVVLGLGYAAAAFFVFRRPQLADRRIERARELERVRTRQRRRLPPNGTGL